MTSKKHRKKKDTIAPVHIKKQKTIRDIFVNVTILAVIVISVICFTDKKGWFDPDNTNNHAQRKWDAYYKFTKKNEIDIVMIGNSHLYAGINPESLSCALGANCFILAAPGTTLTDAYYCLKEAITVCTPKIAVIETYCISDYKTLKLTKGGLSDQFISFHARKNVPQKLLSTPVLFSSDHYLSAWSNTIRNHSYILTDTEQIRKNIHLEKKEKNEQKLYLGRFISFPSGMKDTTLMKYDIPGAITIFDGSNYKIGDEARCYLEKIITLCRKKNIIPVFLTIPMYHRHVQNYDVWKARLAEELAPYQPVWLDLQSPYDYDAYIPDCFENTVKFNQHLTYQGSLVSAYKLAHFINENYPGLLTDRSSNERWKDLFYGEKGYYENYTPRSNDDAVNILSSNLNFSELSIKEINIFSEKEYNTVQIKVEKQSEQDLRGKKLNLTVDVLVEGKQVTGLIEAETTSIYDPLKHYLFLSNVRKDVSIIGVRNAEILKTEGEK